ncbi:M23 family metallopeptidase [Meiothermus granaticius]|uniref:Murein DD-endopeptidase MepM n=1 Tax=Meiothermus granaticius NBRC 107808 TaxID=1227551 RepID=A0A399F6Y4_9DEIN|nr:M23 family metallopeptidase [Meiothermus granaticius]RIH92424.1 Murein DD-endopeptidase MepM [Meiothermus granaticius NBRC 107808]GEM87459.1 hypothetical protein MGR01S_20840 [Meiothermus granaticius NBRC 107808]
MQRLLVGLLAGVALAHTAPPWPETPMAKPQGQFSLPFADPPGPNTWLLGQPYGNTVGAYRQARSLYAAIQGIHFGLDFSAPCGTPVRAIGDGTVVEVDGPHGSPPHNLVIDHGNGVSSLYGHLLRRPSLEVGAKVKRGQVVALSGDSQLTCVSAPHLHLEIRDRSHTRLFNPLPYLAADWPTLLLTGFSRSFERDLEDPRKWQQPDQQPQARRGGPPLANFTHPWPPDPSRSGPAGPLGRFPGLPRSPAALKPTAYAPGPYRLTEGGCCVNPIWSPDSRHVLFIDRRAGQTAYYGVSVAQPSEPRAYLPVAYFSPAFTYAQVPGQPSRFQRLSSGQEFALDTAGTPVLWSPGEQQMAWTVSASSGNYDVRRGQVWVAKPGEAPRQLATVYGGGAVAWLDEHTLLLSGKRSPQDPLRSLETLDLSSGQRRVLSQALNFRGIQPSPGGNHIAYYTAFDRPERNGLWLLQRNGEKQRLNFFGAYQWRDAQRLVYIELQPGVETHVLREYHLKTGQARALADLGTKMSNGDWQVSPDGRAVVFVNLKDRNLWVTALP